MGKTTAYMLFWLSHPHATKKEEKQSRSDSFRWQTNGNSFPRCLINQPLNLKTHSWQLISCSVRYDMSDCLQRSIKTTIRSGLKIQHQTGCVLDRMEHKVLPPGCKHDSLSLTLYNHWAFPCFCEYQPAESLTAVDTSCYHWKKSVCEGEPRVDCLVIDGHNNAHLLEVQRKCKVFWVQIAGGVKTNRRMRRGRGGVQGKIWLGVKSAQINEKRWVERST